MLPEVLCDQKTRDKLGEDGLAAVAASLWARDCQTCGRSLGSMPPALCIDDAGEWTSAALHHPRCRPPGWNDGSAIFLPGGANTSWTSLSFMLPAKTGPEPDPLPAMLINPGLEMIFLEPGGGTWRPAYAAVFTSLGLVPPGLELRFDRPLPGVSAWLADDLISVTLKVPPETIYEARAAGNVVARARELGSILFIVTHSLDPAELYAAPERAWQGIAQLAKSGNVIAGCVAVT